MANMDDIRAADLAGKIAVCDPSEQEEQLDYVSAKYGHEARKLVTIWMQQITLAMMEIDELHPTFH